MKEVPVVVVSSENVPTRINKLVNLVNLVNLNPSIFIHTIIFSKKINKKKMNLVRCLEEGAEMFMLKPLKQSDVVKLKCQLMMN